MKLTLCLLPFWVIISVISALNTDLKGCHLVIPEEVLQRPEPHPETGPLLLHAVFNVLQIRDVPVSGGSFGVDLMKVWNH